MPAIAATALVSTTLTAATAVAFGTAITVGQFAALFAITAIASYLAQPDDPQGGDDSADPRSADSRGLTGAVLPRRWVFGERRVSGAGVWFDADGVDLNIVQVISEGKLSGIGKYIWLDGERIEVEQDPNEPRRYYPVSRERYWRVRTDPYYVYPEDGGERYVAGEQFFARDVAFPQNVPIAPIIEFWTYFQADGTEGRQIRETDRGEEPLGWGENHRLDGVSYIMTHITQTNAGEGILSSASFGGYGEFTGVVSLARTGGLFGTQFPDINFLVQGISYDMPQPNPNGPGLIDVENHFIRDAASVRYWWLRERRKVPAALINMEFFESAMRICQEEIDLTGIDNWDPRFPESIIRYEASGTIVSGDDPVQVEDQLDLAWAGNDVIWEGLHTFRPGIVTPSTLVIGDDDIIEVEEITTILPRQNEFNYVTSSIVQSNRGDYLEQRIEIPSAELVAENERLEAELADTGTEGTRIIGQNQQDIRAMRFVTESTQAANTMRQVLREAASPLTVSVKLKPGDDWRFIGVMPGDRVSLEHTESGIGKEVVTSTERTPPKYRDFRVTATTINPDWSVDLVMRQWHEEFNEYNFELIEPPAGGVAPLDPVGFFPYIERGWRELNDDQVRVIFNWDVQRGIERVEIWWLSESFFGTQRGGSFTTSLDATNFSTRFPERTNPEDVELRYQFSSAGGGGASDPIPFPRFDVSIAYPDGEDNLAQVGAGGRPGVRLWRYDLTLDTPYRLGGVSHTLQDGDRWHFWIRAVDFTGAKSAFVYATSNQLPPGTGG